MTKEEFGIDKEFDRIVSTVKSLGVDINQPVSQIVYHYTSFERAAQILMGGKLRLGDPEDFNDPFDMHSDLIDIEASDDEIVDYLLAFEPRYNRELVSEYLKTEGTNNPNFIKGLVTEDLVRQKKNIGVVCFSQCFKRPLMWSHYADKHRGICLGFKYQSLRGSMMMPVIYRQTMESVKYFDKTKSPYVNWGFLKSVVWEDEKEVRNLCLNVSKYTDDNRLLPFDKSLILEIFIGVKAPAGTEEMVHGLLKGFGYDHQNIRVERMVINPATYDFSNNKASLMVAPFI